VIGGSAFTVRRCSGATVLVLSMIRRNSSRPAEELIRSLRVTRNSVWAWASRAGSDLVIATTRLLEAKQCSVLPSCFVCQFVWCPNVSAIRADLL